MLEWLQNPIISIAFAIGLMFFGYFFGLFEGRGQGYKRRQGEEAEEKEAEPVPQPLPDASPAIPADETPILNVSKDESGQLHLKMDGQRMNPAALTAEDRKRIIAVLTQMRPWLETPASAQPAAQPKPASPPQEARARVASSPPESTAVPATEPRPTTPPPVDDEKDSVTEPQSIVAQIDSILQAQIAGTPLLEKGIRLQESPEGGVIVWVGINKYEGVNEVPDEQIQAAIRSAIATWESKFTPGL